MIRDAIVTVFETGDDKEIVESTNIHFYPEKGEIEVDTPKTEVRPIITGGRGEEMKGGEERKRGEERKGGGIPDSIISSESDTQSDTKKYVYDNKKASIEEDNPETFSPSAGGGVKEVDALMYKPINETPSIYLYDNDVKSTRKSKIYRAT